MNRHHEIRSLSSRGARALPAGLRLGAGLIVGLFCTAATLAQDDIPGVGEPGGPTTQLSPAEMRLWLQGREVFDRDFTVATGLGVPEYNADSCRGCHADPVLGGAGGLELNVSRFGHDGGGTKPFVNLPGGQGLSKLRPPPDGTRENYPKDQPDPADNADVFEQRQTPTALGIGLIQSISDAEILSHEDPFDANGDGIFGVARLLTIAGKTEVGRFGWKAQAPLVTDFVHDASGGELGLTTPDDGRGYAFLSDGDAVADPELSPEDTDAMTFFLENLGPPIPGGSTDPIVTQGKALFTALRCDRCHIPVMKGSGPKRRVPLYSDLLLHNVMAPDFHGMSEPGAESGMFRTPPLWGVKDTAPYLHDGRAETLEQAILMHKSEGLFSSTAFEALTADDQLALIAFLENL